MRSTLSLWMLSRKSLRLSPRYSVFICAQPGCAVNHPRNMMAVYFMHYKFVRIHQTLKVTPAMAAGVTSKLWEMSDMVKVLEDWEVNQQCRHM